MNSLIEQFADFFPLFFVSLWLAVTTILAVLSGWFRLMARFPNQTVEPLLRIRGQSGSMGLGVSMQGGAERALRGRVWTALRWQGVL